MFHVLYVVAKAWGAEPHVTALEELVARVVTEAVAAAVAFAFHLNQLNLLSMIASSCFCRISAPSKAFRICIEEKVCRRS